MQKNVNSLFLAVGQSPRLWLSVSPIQKALPTETKKQPTPVGPPLVLQPGRKS